MGTTLTGKIVAETYDSLLKVTDNNVITGTKKRITDGFGNDTPLLLSSTDVQIDGNLLLPGTTAQYVRGDGSFATFTDVGLTSVGITLGSTGTDANVSGSPLTANGAITLNLPTASATNRGLLSSTDWSTFNNKVSTSRTLTINGTTFDLSANRSWTIADTGLTSVGISMPTAFSVTGSPLTANGTISIAGAGSAAQYIDGTGSLQTFPTFLSADKLITEVYNNSGATLTKGTIVYINGTQGNLPTIAKALATGDATSAQTFGFVQADITNMNNGYVIVAGKLTDLDTSAYTGGTQLYLSPTTAGTYTSTKQYAPNHLVYVGIVVRAHPTQGSIEVKIQNGYELDELHDVIAQTPTNNDGIFYNSTSTKWENKSIATALGFTPVTNARTISTTAPLSGGGDLSANRTLSISQANTSTNGFLSSTDWNTFNSKVPSTRTLTINGTAYDLSADRSWTIAGGLSGSGTTNYVAKFTGTSALGNSQIFDNGTNVGIGTSSPSNKLQVYGTTDTYLANFTGSSGGATARGLTIGTYTSLGAGDCGVEFNAAVNNTGYGQFRFSAGTNERMRIDSSGNVGIGTTTPASKLSVWQGEITISNLDASYTIPMGSIGAYNADATNGGLIFKTSLSGTLSERVRIQNNGYVGIGTSSPAILLDINSSSTNDRLALSHTGSAKCVFGVTSAGANYLYHHTSSTFPIYISTTGNFGIGTATPAAKLDVAGNIVASGTLSLTSDSTEQITIKTLTDTNRQLLIGYNYSSNQSVIQSVQQGVSYRNIALNPNGGNVLISSASDNSLGKLQVNGSISVNSGDRLYFDSSAGTLSIKNSQSGAGGNMQFYSGGTATSNIRMQIASDGAVAIYNIFNAQAGTTYSLAIGDAGRIIEMQNSGANSLIIPLDSSVNFPIGTEIQVLQFGAGQTTIVATSGVTTRSKSNQLKIANQSTGVTLVKRAANDWYVIGNLTA